MRAIVIFFNDALYLRLYGRSIIKKPYFRPVSGSLISVNNFGKDAPTMLPTRRTYV